MIDSIGFSKEFVNVSLNALDKHIKSIGGSRSTDRKNTELFQKLFGNNYQIFLEIYPFVIWPKRLQDIGNYENYIMGGYTINDRAHLGSFVHINTINNIIGTKNKVISFNDLDSKNSIRNVSFELEKKSIESFHKICHSDIVFQKRMEDKIVTKFFNKFENEIEKYEFDQVLNRKTSLDEKKSLNIQAAAYLAPQFEKSSIIVGFDGIEEASRSVWINYIADKYNLPGFVNFISMQVPSLAHDNLKMGKSNPLGSIMVGDSIIDSTNKLKSIDEPNIARIVWFIIDLLFENKGLKIKIDSHNDSEKFINISFDLNQRGGFFKEKSFNFNDWVLVLGGLRMWATSNHSDEISTDENLKSILFNTKENIISFSSLIKNAKIFSQYSKLVKQEKDKLIFVLPVYYWNKVIHNTRIDSYLYEDLFKYIYSSEDNDIQKFKTALIDIFILGYSKKFPLVLQ